MNKSTTNNTTTATSGRKPKRIRRKCAHEGCDNRVVQGGVCVTHGAKRKLCSFPDCDKAVKLAGNCLVQRMVRGDASAIRGQTAAVLLSWCRRATRGEGLRR